MPNLTLSISEELATKMAAFPEINWSELCRRYITAYIEERTPKVEGALTAELEKFLTTRLPEPDPAWMSSSQIAAKNAEIQRFTTSWGEPRIISFHTQFPFVRLKKTKEIKAGNATIATLRITNDIKLNTTTITPSGLGGIDPDKWKHAKDLEGIVDFLKKKGFIVGAFPRLMLSQLWDFVTDGDKKAAEDLLGKGTIIGLFALDSHDLVCIAYRIAQPGESWV